MITDERREISETDVAVLAAEAVAGTPSLSELARTLSPEAFARYLTDADAVVVADAAADRHPVLVATAVEASARVVAGVACLLTLLVVGLGALLLAI